MSIPDKFKLNYLRLAHDQENRCEAQTESSIDQIEDTASQLLEAIGQVLCALDEIATCLKGCYGGDHTIHNLVCRVISHARASIRLLYFGYYDECLTLTRNSGEIANLLLLFRTDSSSLEDWKRCSDRDRWNHYKPASVRNKLNSLGDFVVINKDRYSLLSQVASHASPDTSPQNFNKNAMPTLGGYLRLPEARICLNELSIPLYYSVLCSLELLPMEEPQYDSLKLAGIKLVESIGEEFITGRQGTGEQ